MNDEERAAFRAFVRENHPDRGGDPEVFVAGLARFGTAAPSGSGVDGAGRTGESRFDRPVEVVAPLSLPVRVGVALIRTWHRRRHRRVQ
jgi:hypothetical protein